MISHLLLQSTAILGPEDSGNGTLTVQSMKALQVIENVDFVKGKRTLVRTTLQYLQGNQPAANATAQVYLDGQFQAQTTTLGPEQSLKGSLHIQNIIPPGCPEW